MSTTTTVWTQERIRELLELSDKMVVRSIVQIFNRQTEDEKRTDNTSHSNGIGFNGVDAPLLSSFAKQILKGYTLSSKQMTYARKKIMKYSKQLTRIANKEL